MGQVSDILSGLVKAEGRPPNPTEIQNWFDKHEINGVVFYRQTLMKEYGKKVRNKPKRSSAQEQRIAALRSRLFEYT